MKNYDIVILGGGPGGYVAAARASQLGLKTAIIEKDRLGGTCLNWGCIPTKSLLKNAEVVHMLTKGREFGFSFDHLTVDYAVAHKRSRSVVQRQSRRLGILMKKHGISVIEGTGRLKTSQTIEITETGDTIEARQIIIATGARSRALPAAAFDHQRIINYRRALNLNKVPDSAVIIGAGPIGMEFATLWRRYGCNVTVIEMLPHVLPQEDEDIAVEVENQCKRNGIGVYAGTTVERLTSSEDGAEVVFRKDGVEATLTVDTVLVSIGFAPNSADLGLKAAGVALNNGFVAINDRMQSSVPHIYAIGDVTGKLGLAHVASAQGIVAAEAIAGQPTQPLIYRNMPRCTYAAPETASVGLTEAQAREMGVDVKAAICPFAANGKALTTNENAGFVKIVADSKSNQIFGVHMVGSHVTELVAGSAGMMTMDATAADLGRTVHPHPSLSESLMEAAHALCGHAIHI